MEGHTIEFRINAEDPANNFAPSPCKIEYFLPPGGPGVRVDSACYAGYTIPTHYDSMVAKLIVHGKTRDEAIAIARRALREFHIGGIRSTVPFHLYMLRDPRFLQGTDYDIKYIDGLLDKGATFTSD
jgi:acetyl-CoA carboxylase, biotin carboxylase subunit